MKLLSTLTLSLSLAATLQAAELKPAAVAETVKASGKAFLGAPAFATQQLFSGRGARDIITTRAGNVLAFHDNQLRESINGGATWGAPREVGSDAGGCAVINEANGEVMLIHADKGFLWKSRDNGLTWTRETIKIL